MMLSRRLRVTALTGFVVLSVMLPSTSPGATASPATRQFSPLMLIRVESSSVVYVLGTQSCTRAPCLRLLRTINNGAGFASVTLPPIKAVKGSSMGSLDQIVFASTTEGFALEGGNSGEGVNNGVTLYATYDGARTWKKVREPVGDALSRIAVTPSTLYGVTMHCAKQPVGNVGCLNYRLARTSLKSWHWTSTAIPNGNKYPWGFLGSVAAFGPMVWMSEGAKWSLLVASTDHGATFRTFTPKFPALASVAGCELSAFSATALWAECPTGMEVSFAFSGDAGAKWNSVPTNQFMGTGGGFFDPVSSTLAYLDYGGSRPLYRVSNAGRTMTKAGRLRCSSVNSSVNALVFTSERSGLAICVPGDDLSQARMVRTTDAGATWGRITP